MPQRKSGHVTLLDIAKASGFSVSTVSIVLSEAPLSRYVAQATREHIRGLALKLGYHPDAHARSLRRRSTQTIGVLAFDLSDPFCIPIVRGIQSGVHTVNYLPLVMDAQAQRKLFDSYLNLLLERRVEGLIVIASWVFEETNLLADIRKNNVPIIIVGRDLTSRGIRSILVDNESGGALAMRHLKDLGHRDIAVIRGPKEMSDSQPRWHGIQRVAEETKIRLDADLIFELPGLSDPESGFDGGCVIAKRLLTANRRFTAVLAFDDLTALGVVRGLAEAGVRVPEDCSVMGFDDVLPAKVATPAITTIRQPLNEMGLQAAEQMLQMLRPTEIARKESSLLFNAEPELVVRMSTAAPKAGLHAIRPTVEAEEPSTSVYESVTN
jgi:DNA-binding LacI/PurR family transcriptional regulator